MKPVTAKLDESQVEHLKEMEEKGEAGSISEAVRMEIGRGGGVTAETTLKRFVSRSADSLGMLGVIWVGMTFVYPLEFRAFAIPIFMVALSLHVVDRILAAHEPEVTRRITTVFGGEQA